MTSDRDYLLSLQAVRSQAARVLDAAKANRLNHFHFDVSRMNDVGDYVCNTIERDFGPDKYDTIPPHGRWQHFEVGEIQRIDTLIRQWSQETTADDVEITRRLVDLFFVSVLLDAGAGDVWRFRESMTNQEISRSEGIAVASLHMFVSGAFSTNESLKETVDGNGLISLSESDFNKYFQVSIENPMVGVAARVQLLQSVGRSLLDLPDIFGVEGRPGNLVDFLKGRDDVSTVLDFEELWYCLQKVLIPSWPSNRPVFEGLPIGDAWPLRVLATMSAEEGDAREARKIHPFHKLTQWLAYSLSVPFQRQLHYSWKNLDLGTGLPEYRNGGLFVDLGVLTLKDEDLTIGKQRSKQQLPEFESPDDVIVEWRAMTVALLDELHGIVTQRFQQKGVSLTMPQMLEAGTWKSGRELAAALRPLTKSSPILVISDGTLY